MPKSDSLLSGKRCFVLDDEFLIALDIQQILERAGASHVTSVASAAEAIELLGREPKFDLAVLDVKLGSVERNSLDVAALLHDTRRTICISDRHARRRRAREKISKRASDRKALRCGNAAACRAARTCARLGCVAQWLHDAIRLGPPPVPHGFCDKRGSG